MARLNLTLPDDTLSRIIKHARRQRVPSAGLARTLLVEALDRREALERRRKLAADYAAGRQEASGLLAALEAGELELLE